MSDLQQDLKLALRSLRRSPLFTTVALLTLALGIGANTAVFTVVNGVALRPLPYQNPDRLVSIWTQRTEGDEADTFSLPDYLDLAEQASTLAATGFWTWWSMDITDADELISVPSVRVSANMLDILGVEPAEGRLFRPEEAEPGNDHVALVSHSLWQGHYGGDPNLVGSLIEIDREPHTVVGIMPAGFRFPYVDQYGTGFWTPISLNPAEESRFSRWINVVARLEDEASVEQAGIEVDTIAARLAREYAESNAGWTMRLSTLHDAAVDDDTVTALWVLYAVVAFVLLIACANLANLLLARMETRQHEIAVRAALGAGRTRLLRELLTEAGLLAIGGGALGLVTAMWGMNVLLAVIPADLPRLDEISFDTRVLGFGIAVSLITGVLFGLLPAVHASRSDLQGTLKKSSARTGGARQQIRAVLVVAEIAIALVLLVGAGLLLRSFNMLLRENMGFDPQRVLTFQLSPASAYPDAPGRHGFYRDVSQGLTSLPGVEIAGANTAPPLSGVDWTSTFAIEGTPPAAAGQEPSAQFNVVTPDYFRALAIPVLQGRVFTEDDDGQRPPVVVINEPFANRYWPDETPLGRSIVIGGREGGDESSESPASEVVGVVGNTRKLGIDRQPPPEFYVPYGQSVPYFMNFVVRTDGNPTLVVGAVRTLIWEINDGVAIEDLGTMAGLMDTSIAQPRFNMILVCVFAGLALVLATLGIYGVVAYSAAERTREIGLRMALGAEAHDVFRLILGQGLIMTGVGLAVGLVVAIAASRLLSGLVYGVATTDPATYVVVAMTLASTALIAAWIPARRATRVDPVVALRQD